MPKYLATVRFTFEDEDIGHPGPRLRELADAALDLGFDLRDAKVEDAPDESEGKWTHYAPIDPEQ
jgi:hypothetical protein